jgi:hypothetical protein
VTIGFETLDENLRNNVLGKNLDRELFEEKIELLGKLGIRLTSYVMLKPGPTMTEEEGIKEAVETIKYLNRKCRETETDLVIYLNPTYIARGSPLAYVMKSNGYKPPKIQSIVKVIFETKHLGTPIYTGLWCEDLSEPSGDFTERGDYDISLREAVKNFNKAQDFSVFDCFKNELQK